MAVWSVAILAGRVFRGSRSVLAASQPNSQQESKLVGTGAIGPAEQGYSVAMSADGNTAIVGGVADNKVTGAAWVFTRSGTCGPSRAQAGRHRPVGQLFKAVSVALSADGNTASWAGLATTRHTGAAWVFIRNGGVWTQQGGKLVGTGAVGPARQGFSVALSADGNTAIVGGSNDNSGAGAAWVFTRSGGVWTQQG